jgi:hypothetical protein
LARILSRVVCCFLLPSPKSPRSNSVTRNIPVHRFLQRHVYGASRRHMSRPVATLITFLISALAHELVMFCITKKLRGYGFVCQMLQLPIIVVQRTEFMKSQKTFNNIMFWSSMIWGLSMVSSQSPTNPQKTHTKKGDGG